MDLAMQANLKSGLYEYIKWIVRQQRSSVSGKKTVPVVNELNKCYWSIRCRFYKKHS